MSNITTDTSFLEDLMKSQNIGYSFGEKGYYMGNWRTPTVAGQKARKFRIFLAPEKLKDTEGNILRVAYGKAVNKVFQLKDWHHHNGILLPDETDVIKTALSSDHKKLENWFIPTFNMLKEFAESKREYGPISKTFNKGADAGFWTSSHYTNPKTNTEDYTDRRHFNFDSCSGSDWTRDDMYPIWPARAELVREL